MSRKHFSILAIVLVAVVVAIALLVPVRTGQERELPAGVLLPGAEERINSAERVVVHGAGETAVTLERGASAWTIAELDGYPVDWDTLRTLLAGLAQARVLETKTANPDYFGRLGLADPDGGDGPGTLLVLTLDGEDYGIVLGDRADGRKGRYVRLADSGPALLVDLEAEVPQTAVGWADQEVIDLASADVALVEVTHPDGETVRVRKADPEDTDFMLEAIPEGRATRSAWAVNALGGALAALRFEDVRAAQKIDWEGATRFRAETFDGLGVTAEVVTVEEQHWLRLEADASPVEEEVEEAAEADPGAGSEGAEEVGATGPPPEVAAEAAAEDDASDVTAEAGRLNRRAGGWAYRIPGYKQETLVKRLEDLLEQPEDEDEGAAGATGAE